MGGAGNGNRAQAVATLLGSRQNLCPAALHQSETGRATALSPSLLFRSSRTFRTPATALLGGVPATSALGRYGRRSGCGFRAAQKSDSSDFDMDPGQMWRQPAAQRRAHRNAFATVQRGFTLR